MSIKVFNKLNNGIYKLVEKHCSNVMTSYDKKERQQYEINKFLDNKQYQELLDTYGKKMSERQKKKIYNLIYKDKLDLLNRHEFFELTNKYPELGKRFTKKILKQEFIEETSMKYNLSNLRLFDTDKYKKTKIEKLDKMSRVSLTVIMCITVLSLVPLVSSIENISANIRNKELIVEYDKKLEEYAESIDKDNMDDLEVITTVLYDIRTNTYYEFPEDSMYGSNFRLVLNDDNNRGVCRNMADKFTATMNKIDPNYKAFNLNVDLIRGTKTNNIHGLEYYDNEFSNPCVPKNVLIDKLTGLVFGDHLVSVIWSEQYNCYLVVDTTNPSIGVLDKGRIHMLNTDTYKFIEYRPIMEYITFTDKSYMEANKAFLSSLFGNINYDYLVNELGLEAQNEEVEKIEKALK